MKTLSFQSELLLVKVLNLKENIVDYDKDNFGDFDKLLYQAAETYHKNLSGSMTDFVGCTTSEIKDIMYTTLKRIVPESDVQPYLDKADLLIA